MEAAKARRRSDLKDDVRLVAVTKNHDAEAMREAIAAGAEIVGESRVQEAEKKYVLFRNTVEWHLIGHLQTNKAKQAVRIFDVIESVDSEKLANAINKEAEKIGKMQDILVQVNLAREQQKSGVIESRRNTPCFSYGDIRRVPRICASNGSGTVFHSNRQFLLE